MTPRSLVIGAGLSLLIGLGEPYGARIIMGSHMSALNGPAAFFLFFLWVGVVQVLLRVIHRRLALGKGELLTNLIYPITKVPLAMAEPPSGSSLVSPFFKSPLMWVGLLMTFGRESLNALSRYYPIVPAIPRYLGQLHA